MKNWMTTAPWCDSVVVVALDLVENEINAGRAVACVSVVSQFPQAM